MFTRTTLSLAALCLLFASHSALEAKSPAAGYWKASIAYGDQEAIEYYVDLTEKEGKLSGQFISPRSGEYPIKSGMVKGQEIEFAVDRSIQGTDVTLEIAGVVTGGKFEGSLSAEGNEFGKVSMTRLPDPIGTWKASAERPDGGEPHDSTLLLERAEKGFKGVVKTEQLEIAVKKAAWKNDEFVIEIALAREDREIPIQIQARFDGENRLKGKWSAKSPTGEEYSGGWSAARQAESKVAQLAAFLGRWDATSVLESGQEIDYSLVLAKDGDRVAARIESERGTTDLREVKAEGKKLTFILDLKRRDDTTMRIDFVAELGSDGALKGKWQTENGASGEWKATKQSEEKKATDRKETRL